MDESKIGLEGDADIAKDCFGTSIVIGANGRPMFQKVFMRQVNGKKIPSFDPSTDGAAVRKVSKLPESTEFKEDEDTVEYLEVGLVRGNDPYKYLLAGNQEGGGNKY
jgi:hypothetical protein